MAVLKSKHSMIFLSSFECKLPEVFKDLHEFYEKIEGRLKAEQFKVSECSCTNGVSKCTCTGSTAHSACVLYRVKISPPHLWDNWIHRLRMRPNGIDEPNVFQDPCFNKRPSPLSTNGTLARIYPPKGAWWLPLLCRIDNIRNIFSAKITENFNLNAIISPL